MDKFKDQVAPPVSGEITPFFHARDNGAIVTMDARPNVVTYSAADLLAHVLAGDTTYLPKHVGFIYGTEPSPGMTDPETLSASIKRAHDWSQITTDVAAAGANLLVAPLAIAPSVSLDGDSGKYTNNAVTFSAHTGLVSEYAFPTSGSTFAPALADIDSDELSSVYVYQVLLLNRAEEAGTVTYTPFSRATLDTEPFTAKPASFDLGVYWTITFK